MKYYFAGERVLTREKSIEAGGGHLQAHKFIDNRLLSYYYHGYNEAKNAPTLEARESAAMGWSMFLDSGAFTAWTKGKDISVEKYAEYLENSAGMWHVVSSLDDIKDPDKSYKNLKRLEQLGCTVIPVFHAGEPEHYLEEYVAEYDYVFIGGLVGSKIGSREKYLDHIWEKHLTNPDGTAKIKLHGFGLTDMVLSRRYPWYSVDSSSWLMTGVFGSCLFWVGKDPIKVSFSDESPDKYKINSWHYSTLSHQRPEYKQVVDQWLEEFGVTAEQCAVHYSYRDTVNAAFYAGLQTRGTDKFVRKSIDLFEQYGL